VWDNLWVCAVVEFGTELKGKMLSKPTSDKWLKSEKTVPNVEAPCSQLYTQNTRENKENHKKMVVEDALTGLRRVH
jgi:hypothetical protein